MTLVDKTVDVIFADHTSGLCRITAVEDVQDGDDGVRLTGLIAGEAPIEVFSDRSIFDATRKLRLALEQRNALLACCASDEAVYPSPMQEAMGLNTLAYRNTLGKQAKTEDVVDIFDTNDSLKAVSVAAQEEFHRRWLNSL